ncbi:hypothetical protein BJV74DRAFT_989280 [Russula compacta]|nr:hypothetical protein BJV74DRAFT_989280 [Russula compacta]
MPQGENGCKHYLTFNLPVQLAKLHLVVIPHTGVLLDEDETDGDCILQGGQWVRERWWYKLTHVCQRWRYLTLKSLSYLHLYLVCTRRTPVADMLAHSPPLPLIIDHIIGPGEVTTKDEEGILLALQHRDRVRRIRLLMSVANLEKLVSTVDAEFPRLQCLYLQPFHRPDTSLILPKTFQAPDLRHLILKAFTFTTRSPFLTSAVGLITLSLHYPRSSAYPHLNNLLQLLLLMPQLEGLELAFFPVSSHDVERQLSHTPIMTYVTLPNLRWFAIQGVSTYLEALLPHITTPLLENSIPCLLQFMRGTESPKFKNARLGFFDVGVAMEVYPRREGGMYTSYMDIQCGQLDGQVPSIAQIFKSLRLIFLTMEHLTLECWEHATSLTGHYQVDRTQWHEFLRSFPHVKTLLIKGGLVGDFSRCLRLDDGELPPELLPKLKELEYSAGGEAVDAFAAFVDARQIAGRPVTLHLLSGVPTEIPTFTLA